MALHTPGGGVNISRFVFGETPLPAPDGVVDDFTAAFPYVSGTLRVYRDGVRVDFTETDPAAGTFELLVVPDADEEIIIDYIKK